jgi:pimeloyl-ACP methyl ester carboxylesterase
VERPRVLLVHGSVVGGEATWGAQRPLAERFDVVVLDRRGFPPNAPVEHVDFEDEAAWLEQWLEPGTHLVGHSYGGVISLLAAARRPDELRSLVVIEPPAFGVARGEPAVDEFVALSVAHWEEGPRDP